MNQFTDPKTKQIYDVDRNVLKAIYHSQEFVRKAAKRDFKKKLSQLSKIESLEEVRVIIKKYVEENKWNLSN